MKKLVLIMLLGVMAIVAGCTSSGGSGDSRENGFELDSSFNGGDDALVFSFLDQAPPSNIRDQGLQPFSVRLEIENLGEYDIPDNTGFVSLTGFNPRDLGLNDTSKPLMNLRGYKKQGDNTIPGGRQQVVFDNLRYENSVVSGSVPLTIFANVCYPYETRAFALACINGDTVPSLDERTEICDLEGSKEFANSGGPVKIDNVEQYAYGQNSIQIQFDIVHTPTSDQSNLYERGSIDSNCRIDGSSPGSSEALFKRDKVTYEVQTGIPGLSCEGTGTGTNTVTLTENRYTVTCIQNTLGEEEYPKPISIFLKYDYLDRESVDIRVEHIDTN